MPHSASVIINAHSSTSNSHPATAAVPLRLDNIAGLPETRFGFITFHAAAAVYRTPAAKPEGLVKMPPTPGTGTAALPPGRAQTVRKTAARPGPALPGRPGRRVERRRPAGVTA